MFANISIELLPSIQVCKNYVRERENQELSFKIFPRATVPNHPTTFYAHSTYFLHMHVPRASLWLSKLKNPRNNAHETNMKKIRMGKLGPGWACIMRDR